MEEPILIRVDNSGFPLDTSGNRMLRSSEAAERLHKEASWVRRLLQRGRIPATRLAGDWWIAKGDLDHFAKTHHPRRRPIPSGTNRVPTTVAEWDATPYFIWDYPMTWRQFWNALHSDDDALRSWAYGRLLQHASWPDIWKLVTLADVARELPHAQLKDKPMWEQFIADAVVKAA